MNRKPFFEIQEQGWTGEFKAGEALSLGDPLVSEDGHVYGYECRPLEPNYPIITINPLFGIPVVCPLCGTEMEENYELIMDIQKITCEKLRKTFTLLEVECSCCNLNLLPEEYMEIATELEILRGQ